MVLPSRFLKSTLTSRASIIAIVAAASSLASAPPSQASCDGVLRVTPGIITGTHDCAVAKNVIGNVINNGTIGPPGENDPGFLVGTGGITGSLLNNGKIFGAGNHLGGIGLDEGEDDEGYGILGALTIATHVSGGVTNAGTISSVEGNAKLNGIALDG